MRYKHFIQLGHAKVNLLSYCIILFVLLVAGLNSNAKNYYFSSSTGNDSYSNTQAQNQATPWKSTTKLNSIFSTLVAGDVVYLKRGDIFYGAITVNRAGANGIPITITAYGTGNRPVISGFTTLSSWISIGKGIYQATTTGISNTVNMVTLNNQPQAIGRYPNANAPNGGYLNFESSSANTITDDQLRADTNWAGAELVIRKVKHVIERWPITKQTGNVITYSPGSVRYASILNGFGYFIQKDTRCLDQLGEWFYNTSTKYLQMYFGTANPSSYVVKVSTVDTLINISKCSNITVSELAFEGANVYGVNIGSSDTASTSAVRIQNCDFNVSGRNAVYATNTTNLQVSACNINNSYNNAIEIENEGSISTFSTITYNNIKNTGAKAGMAAGFGNSHQAITAYSSDALIEYNTIDSTGYIGIAFYYNNSKVRFNFISNFTFVKDDGGAIYSWTGPVGGPVYKGREVKNNILINGIGAGYGTPLGAATTTTYGIYMDDGVVGVDISGNSIANVAESGLYIHNTHEVNITNNTVYNCSNNQILFVHDNITPTDPIRNVVLSKNILVAKKNSQLCFNMRTIKNDINQTGTTDSNYYARPVDDGMVMGGLSSVLKTNYSLEGWKASFTSKDAHSKKSPKNVQPYRINSLITGNLLKNGDFASDISGMSFWSENSNQLATWDATGKLTGTGSLKISFPVSTPTLYTLCTKPVGAVSSSKNYILRITMLGSTYTGSLRAYFRKTASPYNNLVPAQIKSFGISRLTHEFLFTAPVSDADASLVIEVQQNSGTTYIDDIQLFEANVTPVSIDDLLRFEYNATSSARTISLGSTYIGIDGTIYNGSLTLQPFTSKVLINNSENRAGDAVPSAFQGSSIAPAINCFGGTSTVTVSAAGGTTPYTGTGSFTVNAGKGSLKLSVPSPVAATYSLLYGSVGQVSSSKIYILRFTTLGTTANGNLRASLRQTNSPWTVITSPQLTSFGATRVDHQFVFNAPPTQSAASFLIEILQTSGTVYIDNISFFEASTSGGLISDNLYAGGQFENSIANITAWSAGNNHVISLDQSSKISNTYYYPVKDATGAISTAIAMITQPSAALQAISTAGNIVIAGGTTTVVVSATGGTAPYVGTGSFTNVKAGIQTYTVTDARGCTSVTTVTVTQNVAARAANPNIQNSDSAATALFALSYTDSLSGQSLSMNARVETKLKVSSYPNPTIAAINVILEGGSGEAADISVLSIDGRMVARIQGPSNKRYTFDNDLIAGIYIIQVRQGKTMQILKVIKARQ